MSDAPVLLINANTIQPPIAPIGLDYLADALRAEGFNSLLLDLNWEPDPLVGVASVLSAVKPLAVGLSIRNTDNCYLRGSCSYLPQFRDLVTAVRAKTDAPVILGGCGFSVFGAPLCRHLGADFGICGDAEQALPALLRAIGRQGHAFTTTTSLSIPGLVTAAQERPSGPAFALPVPPATRSFVDNARYFCCGGQGGFETSRGCDQACLYCADPVAKGRHLRLRRPTDVADELQVLLRQGVDVLHTCDSEFNADPNHAAEVCNELIRRNLGSRIRWYAYCSPQHFGSGLAERMRRAGCVGINFGVDAICDEMLVRLARAHRVPDVSLAVTSCRQEGIAVMLDLLLGGPGETVQTMRETVEQAKRIGPDCVGAALGVRIYPGTELARLVRQQGPIQTNLNLLGQKENNPWFLEPVFYVDQALGPEPHRLLYDMIGGDERFFVGDPDELDANYDYSDNRRLVEAITAGARGAYWDILRRLK